MDIELENIISYEPGDGRQLLAVVEAIMFDEFVISFINPDVIPQTMRVPKYKCTYFGPGGIKRVNASQCECGAEKVYNGKKDPIFHAIWCPVVPRGSYGKHN